MIRNEHAKHAGSSEVFFDPCHSSAGGTRAKGLCNSLTNDCLWQGKQMPQFSCCGSQYWAIMPVHRFVLLRDDFVGRIQEACWCLRVVWGGP
jgi:hypothetical protein